MTTQSALPLDGILVLDFSQFLAGPVAAMRLADLGARVIKIERPGIGDIGRTLAFAGRSADGDTISFHAMNRNKESVAADLKDAADLAWVKHLVTKADRPGQDLLAQSVSGMPWLSGSRDDGPVPVGLSIADHLMSCHIAQGVTALLVRRFRSGLGGYVQTSLLEAMLDLQFELLSTHLNDSTVTVGRGGEHSANAFLSAPYGTYPTSDGYLALAMNPVSRIGELLGIAELAAMTEPEIWWQKQDQISELLAAHFALESTDHWLGILDPADVWCAPVLTLEQLVAHEGFDAIAMTQQIERTPLEGGASVTLTTTRSPLRIDGAPLTGSRPAPRLGEHTEAVRAEFADRRES
jgi:CoA:oxalate CoA-transferase